MSLQIGKTKIPHRLILAPMCGITLKPFRLICKELGAGLVFNQMVSAKALTRRDPKSLHLMGFDESERPVGLQVFGNDATTLAEAAQIMQEKNPDIIDLNLGCPAKKIVNDGGGSALMSDPDKLKKIFQAMRKTISGTFTIKIRAGWDEKSKNAIAIAKMAEGEGIDAVAIHARTRTQGYSGNSDWNFIKTLKENLKIPVMGNGDIKTAEDAKRMLQETNCDAVMTGRGAFENPWIFRNFIEISEKLKFVLGSCPGETPLRSVLKKSFSEISKVERKKIIFKQYEHAMAYHGVESGIKMMRKHLCAYTKGIPGGAEFRNQIVRISDWMQIQKSLEEFFSKLSLPDFIQSFTNNLS